MLSKLVTKVEVTGPIEDLGVEAAKQMPHGYRHRYRQRGRITMEDGTTDDYTFHGLTKHKLAADISRVECYVMEKRLCAEYNEQGKRWGTKVTFGNLQL